MAELLSSEEAAKLLHMHVKRVQQLARAGKIPSVRHGRRWLFRREDLLRVNATSRTSAISAAEDGAAEGIELSARNQLRGTIRSVSGDGLFVEVVLIIEPQELVAVITRASAERLGLRTGSSALGVVKATEVMVAREHTRAR